MEEASVFLTMETDDTPATASHLTMGCIVRSHKVKKNNS